MSEKEIFIDKKNMYRLFENENRDLFIGVTCGSIGLYEIKFKLNEEELRAYQSNGKQALDNLSYLVAKNTERYLERDIN